MDDTLVLTRRNGGLLEITLNRPKALNSLNGEMVTLLDAALDAALAEDAIRAVTITGAGGKAFCAGGDIRFLMESRTAGTEAAADFWAREYRLNARIAAFPKPYIALVDGICMGGGVGVSAHGSLRIVTDRARIAMPETGIGFIPDVGATWLLTRSDTAIGRYMALTGATLGAADAIAAGLADVCVASDALPDLVAELAAAPEAAQAIAARHAITPPAGLAETHASDLARLFADDDLAAVRARLDADGSDFAAETKAIMAQKSPTSMAATARLLAQGRRAARLEDCLDAEFSAALGALVHPDFAEGVRAAIIDKDRNPRWSPASPAGVTEADIARYLAPKSGAPFGGQTAE